MEQIVNSYELSKQILMKGLKNVLVYQMDMK